MLQYFSIDMKGVFDMKISTQRGSRDRRRILIGRIVKLWIACIFVLGALFIYEDMTAPPQPIEDTYVIIEDEPAILGSYKMLAAASGIKIVASILAILTIGFIVLSFFSLNHNRKDGKGRKKTQRQQELTVRRIDVGASAEKESDVDELLIAQTQEEKVTFSKTVKILLVEDNQINMDVAQYMLEEEGIYVHLAKDGKEAVEQFEKLPAEEIDLILMDVMMPGMDGIEATKLIRSSSKENAGTIPIIALTASRNEEDIQRTKEAGMNEYLNKPFDIDATLEIINKYVK